MAPSSTPKIQNQTSLLSQSSQNKRSRRAHPSHPNPRSNPRNVAPNNPNHPTFDHVPQDVLGHIISFLPIKTAAQLGILSKRFKDSWLYSRHLIFDREFSRRLRGRTQLICIVDTIFDSHAGNDIQSFRLFIDPSEKESLVHKWIEKAIDKGLQELDLDFDLALEPFMVPNKYMDVLTLRTLKLTYCKIEKLSFDLKDMRFLTTLVLRKVILEDSTIDAFVHNCANLETLDLAECYGITRINITTRKAKHKRFKVLKVGYCYELFAIDISIPTLLSIHYCGPMKNIRVFSSGDDGVSNLKEAMLSFTFPRSGITKSFLSERLIRSSITNVEVLTTTSVFLEGLTARVRDGVFGSYQFCLWRLKECQLYLDSTSYCNLYDIASFISKCPQIERLFIDMNDYNFDCGSAYWELHQKPSLEAFTTFFHALKFIKLRGFKFVKHEIEMVRFFLKRSPHLQVMALLFPKNGNVEIQPSDASVYGRLFRSWKASQEAQILVYEHWNDTTIPPMHLRIWY